MDGKHFRALGSVMDSLDELQLQKILNNLTEAADRRAWRLVCKTTYNLEVRSRKRVQLLRVELLASVLRKYRNVQELDLSLCMGVRDEQLATISGLAASRLVSIDLHKVSGFSNAGLLGFARHCSRLAEVDLSYCNSLGDIGLIGVGQLSGLRKLSLTGCVHITDAGLGCVAEGCTELEVLLLKGCSGITDAGVHSVVINCRKLCSLDLSVTEVTDNGVEDVSSLGFLRTLCFRSCNNNVGDTSLATLLNRCTSLEELDISLCLNVSNVVISSGVRLRSLNLAHTLVTEDGLKQLQTPNALQILKLDFCELTDQGLRYVATGCKGLQELSLLKCRGVTDEGLMQVLEECKGLTKLDLTCCSDLTENALLMIATMCPHLRSLKMEYSSMVTQNSLSFLWENCKMLEEVDATSSNATDSGLETIGNCSSLKSLKLAYCNIRDYGISRLRSCIVYLDLYRCYSVGDSGVSAVSKCRSLQVLNLSYCSKITDVSMSCISTLKQLYQLEIRKCVLVTSGGLKQVAQGCRLLEELDIKRCVRIDDHGVLALEAFCPYLSQINVSYCPLTEVGMMCLARLACMQNLKLVHLRNVERMGYALLECRCLRKVKLLSCIKTSLPAGVVKELESRGCRLRWVDKPL